MRIIELLKLLEEEEPLNTPNVSEPIQPSAKPVPVPPEKQMGAEPKKQTKKQQPGKVEQPIVFNNKQYADLNTTKQTAVDIEQLIKQQFPNAAVRVDKADSKVGKLVPAIRILNALPKDQVKQTIAASYALQPADEISSTVTGTYQADTYSFVVGNSIATLILAGKGSKEGKAQVGIQQLRPNKLGLVGDNTKAQVIEIVKQSLEKVVGRDPQLLEALRQLVDVAAGTRQTIDPELNDHIRDSINLISQDFGEVLTPIKMAESDSDIINFPEQSNQPLIDAKVEGRPIAVKSLGGSGNSFAVIQDLIDEYEEEVNKNPAQIAAERRRMLSLIREFNKAKGDTRSNLIRVAQLAPTDEALALNDLVGFTPNNYKDMIEAVKSIMSKITSRDKTGMYKEYLEMILPISMAGKRLTDGKKPKVQAIGMPSDWQHYTGRKDLEELKPKSSGKKYFDADFVTAAADQLTYMLGWSFKLDASDKGKHAEEMSQLITDIMTKKKAVAAKIIITPNGGIDLKITPFSDLRFGYQYHAGTNRPSQNAPGFSIYFPKGS